MTSTHGAWRHAGARFLLPGVLMLSTRLRGVAAPSTCSQFALSAFPLQRIRYTGLAPCNLVAPHTYSTHDRFAPNRSGRHAFHKGHASPRRTPPRQASPKTNFTQHVLHPRTRFTQHALHTDALQTARASPRRASANTRFTKDALHTRRVSPIASSTQTPNALRPRVLHPRHASPSMRFARDAFHLEALYPHELHPSALHPDVFHKTCAKQRASARVGAPWLLAAASGLHMPPWRPLRPLRG